MVEKTCFLLGVVLYLAVAAQAAVIVRRSLGDSVDVGLNLLDTGNDLFLN